MERWKPDLDSKIGINEEEKRLPVVLVCNKSDLERDPLLPNDFEITARSDSGTIQGIRHKNLSLEGVQFHPESIETEHGKKILNNFLKMK